MGVDSDVSINELNKEMKDSDGVGRSQKYDVQYNRNSMTVLKT